MSAGRGVLPQVAKTNFRGAKRPFWGSPTKRSGSDAALGGAVTVPAQATLEEPEERQAPYASLSLADAHVIGNKPNRKS
jgi:hypothetical protein